MIRLPEPGVLGCDEPWLMAGGGEALNTYGFFVCFIEL